MVVIFVSLAVNTIDALDKAGFVMLRSACMVMVFGIPALCVWLLLQVRPISRMELETKIAVNTRRDQELLAAVNAALVDEVRSLNGYRQECQRQRPDTVALRDKYTGEVKFQKVGWSWTYFLLGLGTTFAYGTGFEAFAITNGTQQNEPALMQLFFAMLPMLPPPHRTFTRGAGASRVCLI
jgi:hypothetical protein